MIPSHKLLVLAISLFLLVGFTVGAVELQDSPTEMPDANGKELEKQMWEAMSAGNMNWVKKHIASDFQSVHSDGARSRSGELRLIKGLNLNDYKLSNFKTTQTEDQIIVTYTISVAETIDGERTNTQPAPRLSVWTWNSDKERWQWTAHANLKPLQE